MIKLDIRDDFKEAAKAYELLLSSKDIEDAINRALNKAIVSARTASVKEVRKIYKTRDKDIRKSFKISKARGSKKEATLSSTGENLGAYGFMSAPNKITNAGASVNVKGQSKVIAHSFITKVKFQSNDGTAGTHLGLFIRTGVFGIKSHKERIRELFTISIPGALANRIIEESVDASIDAALPDLIIHELDFAVLLKSGAVTLGRR